MSEPLVSVIVPNYNHSSYLVSRIDSILAQEFSDFELILLDDCSTDNSRDILLKYQNDSRVTHIIFNEQNSGTTFKQWDKGLLLARGKYIWIAESDDFAESNFLAETVAALEENPDVVLAYTGSQMVDAEGKNITLDWDKFPGNLPVRTKFLSRDFLLRNMLWGTSVYNASMVLFRKECYAKVNCSYKEFRYCGDWFFWVEICRQGNVIRVNRKLNYFRQHDNKVSPKAEKEGAYFIEGGRILEYMTSLLDLSAYQQWVVSGRTLKRLLKDAKTRTGLKQKAMAAHPKLYRGGFFSIWIYQFDKIFNISHLHR